MASISYYDKVFPEECVIYVGVGSMFSMQDFHVYATAASGVVVKSVYLRQFISTSVGSQDEYHATYFRVFCGGQGVLFNVTQIEGFNAGVSSLAYLREATRVDGYVFARDETIVA